MFYRQAHKGILELKCTFSVPVSRGMLRLFEKGAEELCIKMLHGLKAAFDENLIEIALDLHTDYCVDISKQNKTI